jgi:hypothetical protein
MRQRVETWVLYGLNTPFRPIFLVGNTQDFPEITGVPAFFQSLLKKSVFGVERGLTAITV